MISILFVFDPVHLRVIVHAFIVGGLNLTILSLKTDLFYEMTLLYKTGFLLFCSLRDGSPAWINAVRKVQNSM
jgi:hypothetical protein